MSPLKKGLLLAAIQVAIVASLGAKLEWDRWRLPRAWAPTRRYDPNLPIRGRYLSLQLFIRTDFGNSVNIVTFPNACNLFRKLYAKDDQLWAKVQGSAAALPGANANLCPTSHQSEALLITPVLFFLPEHAVDPSPHGPGSELWAEVTVPENGPPRPIRLAIKQGNTFTPLETK